MPYRTFDLHETARYLHLRPEDVQRLVKNQDIPFERHGERLLFRKVAIDSWASQRILGMEGRRLVDYHENTSRGIRQVSPSEAIMPGLIRPSFIDPALKAKTKSSVLRALTRLAEATSLLWDAPGLLQSLEGREALCSTGVPGGVAFPHPRSPDPFLMESSFIVLGRSAQAIPFGASDGRETDLFFLICCKEDRLHLHTLARLCLMAQKTELLEQLRQTSDTEALHQTIIRSEEAVIGAPGARA